VVNKDLLVFLGPALESRRGNRLFCHSYFMPLLGLSRKMLEQHGLDSDLFPTPIHKIKINPSSNPYTYYVVTDVRRWPWSLFIPKKWREPVLINSILDVTSLNPGLLFASLEGFPVKILYVFFLPFFKLHIQPTVTSI
jgi:hypothetical protein